MLVLLVVAAALAAPTLASARPPATYTWCGTDETQQNRVPDLEVSRAEQVRFIYAIPSDGTDNFQATANGIVNDAAWIDQWWQAQDPTRTPRFDRYPFPGCTSPWGQLDIGFIRLPHNGAYYAMPDSPSIVLDNDLARTFPATQKTIVYYDGPIQEPDLCGATDFLGDFTGGDHGIAYVFLQSCSLGPPGGGRTAAVAAHELSHSLGAVAAGAPHECPDNPNHACDSADDLMYPFIGDDESLDSVTLDVGRDDYYAHTGPQWDIRDSPWLENLPQFPVTLATQGSGTLSATAGRVRLPCDGGCSGLALDGGTRVGVVAVPAAGWMFRSWAGACSGTVPTCTLPVSAETAATATFVRVTTRITVVVAGKGRVTSTPSSVACPGICRASFTVGAVALAAKASPGWRFAGWSGACHGNAGCVTNGIATVRARFTRA